MSSTVIRISSRFPETKWKRLFIISSQLIGSDIILRSMLKVCVRAHVTVLSDLSSIVYLSFPARSFLDPYQITLYHSTLTGEKAAVNIYDS